MAAESRHILQNAATTGNGTAVDTRQNGSEHTFYIAAAGTITAGAIQIETARSDDYTGTWAALGSAVTLTTNTTAIVQITGCLLAVRARVSTNLTGTTPSVTVEYVSN